MALGVLLSVIFMIYALWGVDFRELWSTLLGADPLWLALGILLMLLALVCRSLRWRVLMAPIVRVGVIDVNAFSMIGQMFNALLPAKLGEVARTALVSRKYRTSLGAVLSTVAADRLLDMISLVLLTLILPLSFRLPDELALFVLGTAGAAIGGLAALAVIVRLENGPRRFGALVMRGAAWGLNLVRVPRPEERAGVLAAWIEHFIESFRAGVVYLANWRRLAVSVGYTLSGWAFAVAYATCILVAVHAFDRLPPGAGLVLTITTNVSAAAPSTPGNWGLYEGFAKAGFALMGAADMLKPQMIGYAILAHSTWYFSVIILGFLSLAYEGLSLADVRQMTG
jgi:uncharacterized protein (TIRG00374 family)